MESIGNGYKEVGGGERSNSLLRALAYRITTAAYTGSLTQGLTM